MRTHDLPTTPKARQARRERGTILLPIILLVALIGGISVALLDEGLADKASLRMHESNMKALQIAEMGLLKAEMEIRGQIDPDGDGIGNCIGYLGGGSYRVWVRPGEITLADPATTPVADPALTAPVLGKVKTPKVAKIKVAKAVAPPVDGFAPLPDPTLAIGKFKPAKFKKPKKVKAGSVPDPSIIEPDPDVVLPPTPVATGNWVITAVGLHGLSERRIQVALKVTGTTGLFPYALFGKDWVEFGGGGSSDCYDSSLGSWASQVTGADAQGSYAQGCGNIGSNGFIKLSASTIIRGDAIPGPLDIVDKGIVWGSRVPRTVEMSVPDTPYDEFLQASLVNNNGSLNLAVKDITYDPVKKTLKIDGSNTVTLTGGTYFFSNFTLNTNATLKITGPTKLYLTGEVKLGGTIDNVSARAADFVIFNHPYALPPGFTPAWKQFTSEGGSFKSAMAVYAPALHVEMKSSGDLYGACVAKEIKFGGDSDFHYDTSLSGYGASADGTLQTERLYWLDLAPPPR